jgi:Skp family chaperone for outer membrane proteins
MKRIAAFMLLAALSVACSIPAQAQNATTAENMRRSRKEAKQQQKVLKKLSKKQRKAMKKYDKAQRKAAKKANRRAR